jgi:hypothetical protein
MDWGALPAGALQLEAGKAQLIVKALSKSGSSVMDLKGVVLSRLG